MLDNEHCFVRLRVLNQGPIREALFLGHIVEAKPDILRASGTHSHTDHWDGSLSTTDHTLLTHKYVPDTHEHITTIASQAAARLH